MRLLDLDDTALRMHGLITRDGCGWSRRSWYRAIERGTIEQLQPGVARLPGSPRTQLQAIAAAVLSIGGDALASHRSAALLWGLTSDERAPVDIVVPDRCRRATLQGVVLHRPTDGLRLTPQRRHGIRCTNPLRTLVDLGAVAPRAVTGALGHALSSGLVSLDAAARALQEHSRQGRAGVVALRRAIDDWAIDAKPADSVLEPAFARLVARYDLPKVEFHPIIQGWEVDFRIVGTCLIVECDGWTHHGLDRHSFERDRRRDNELAAAGWIVRRFTYRAIVSRPSATAASIRALVERWSATPAPDAR